MDKNTSGTLNANHLTHLLMTGREGMTKEEIEELFSFCEKSKDNDNEIDINSILKVLTP